MAPVKGRRRLRLQLVLWATAGLIVGLSLLALSRAVHPPPPPEAAARSPAPEDGPARPASDTAAANLSAMLFLLALVSLSVPVIAIGWLVVDLRRRPRWQTRARPLRRQRP
jgi:hypothetical protein